MSLQMNYGDLAPSFTMNLQNNDGSPFDLTGCTVNFVMSQNGVVLFSKAATITNHTGGVVQYNWTAGDTSHYGTCTAQFVVTLAGGQPQTFPVSGYYYVIFPLQPLTSLTLPSFTTLNDVMAHLNAQGPTSGVYTVFGLPISQNSAQAQVNHANIYMNTIVTGLGVGDPRYSFAQLAALDMACMGILVNASGGMLTGATDYHIGDAGVTKATVTAFAYKSAVDGYRDDFKLMLMNFTTVAMSRTANLSHEVPRYQGALVSP